MNLLDKSPASCDNVAEGIHTTQLLMQPSRSTPSYAGKRLSLGGVAHEMNGETQYSLSVHHGVPVVEVSGDLDHYNIPGFRSVISQLIEGDHRKIIVDMSKVDFMDSGGMAGIIFAIKRLTPLGGHLYLVDCNHRIARKLQIGGLTNLSGVLTLCTTLEQAVKDSQE